MNPTIALAGFARGLLEILLVFRSTFLADIIARGYLSNAGGNVAALNFEDRSVGCRVVNIRNLGSCLALVERYDLQLLYLSQRVAVAREAFGRICWLQLLGADFASYLVPLLLLKYHVEGTHLMLLARH